VSYLGPLRLHFSGQFQADVSTINNDVRHYDNDTFDPKCQATQKNTGSSVFRFVGCRVTMVGYADGTTSRRDSVVGLSIGDAPARVAGKIVDLDPQQQLVSELWGLIVRLTDGKQDFFSGPYTVSPFCDMWWARAQAPGMGGDMAATSFYQSVIGPVTWNDARRSRFLRELRAACGKARLLSIKFNVDGYCMDMTKPNCTLGRVTGTIGPATADEPRRYIAGRQLLPKLVQTQPAVKMNFMPAVVDAKAKRVYADFGNALPTARPAGPLANVGKVQLGWLDRRDHFHAIGSVPYLQKEWYLRTAGVHAFRLTSRQLTAVRKNRLAITQNGTTVLRENDDGLFARADQFVFRLQPGESADVELRATRYGEPLANAKIYVFHDSSGLQPAANPKDPHGTPPPFGVPRRAMRFPRLVKTDRRGRVKFKIKGNAPGNPRGYIDGQVYGIRYILADLYDRIDDGNWTFGWNPSDFLSVLVFDEYEAPKRPTWSRLQPIFQQYDNLYPVMGHIINLGRYDSVVHHARLLAFAFRLPLEDPNHMPVTRDLSNAKRDAILRFLARPLPGKEWISHLPSPPAETAAFAAAMADLRNAIAIAAGITPQHGSKTFAVYTRGEVEEPSLTD